MPTIGSLKFYLIIYPLLITVTIIGFAVKHPTPWLSDAMWVVSGAGLAWIYEITFTKNKRQRYVAVKGKKYSLHDGSTIYYSPAKDKK